VRLNWEGALPLVVFGREVEFDSREERGAVLIVADKGASIGKVTEQGVVSSLGCFLLLYPL
jgi:hypothetical protein